MQNVPSADARHVTTTSASKSIPVLLRMPGFTNMIYDIVTKVVMPARISVMNVLPFSRILNNDISVSLSVIRMRCYYLTKIFCFPPLVMSIYP